MKDWTLTPETQDAEASQQPSHSAEGQDQAPEPPNVPCCSGGLGSPACVSVSTRLEDMKDMPGPS